MTMKKTMGWMFVGLLFGTSIVGCADGGKGPDAAAHGSVALPLVSNGPSGVAYRLRNASFTVSPYDYYYGGGGSGGGGQAPLTVSSETDPNAQSIEVEVESGYYYVSLADGWSMERVENGLATPVEAQLLNGQTQWISVSRHSTSWVRYQFGIGDHALWFNGELNIDMNVYESPEQYYGGGIAGAPGYAGASGVSGASNW
jgi:hypothetical protein